MTARYYCSVGRSRLQRWNGRALALTTAILLGSWLPGSASADPNGLDNELEQYNIAYCKETVVILLGTCSAVATYRFGDHAVVLYKREVRAPGAPGMSMVGEIIYIVSHAEGAWKVGDKLMTKGVVNSSPMEVLLVEDRLMKFAKDEASGDRKLLRDLVARLAWRVDGFCEKYRRACSLVP